MTIKEKARDAWERTLQVTVVTNDFQEYTGWITSYKDDAFAWEHPCGARYAFKYEDIADIRFVGEEVDRSYPHCDCTECKERQGSGLYCKDQKCGARFVFVEFSDSFREDPKSGKKWPPDEDVAKEQWESTQKPGISRKLACGEHEGYWYVYDRTQCVGLGKYRCVAKIDLDVPVELREDYVNLFAAAPDLLDALRMVRDARQSGRVDLNSADDEDAVRLFNEIVIGALKKAGLE